MGPALPQSPGATHTLFAELASLLNHYDRLRAPDLPVVGRTRSELLERAGKVQVPYLVDPNTDTALFESGAIRTYLLDTYAR